MGLIFSANTNGTFKVPSPLSSPCCELRGRCTAALCALTVRHTADIGLSCRSRLWYQTSILKWLLFLSLHPINAERDENTQFEWQRSRARGCTCPLMSAEQVTTSPNCENVDFVFSTGSLLVFVNMIGNCRRP